MFTFLYLFIASPVQSCSIAAVVTGDVAEEQEAATLAGKKRKLGSGSGSGAAKKVAKTVAGGVQAPQAPQAPKAPQAVVSGVKAPRKYTMFIYNSNVKTC